ncbi:DUF4296 domain-containing protein [Hymenobacter koreensis]|uniref:DUF4296 domain-containing protein n=1 Tax=Hymenobacter koreensis TaxID=1084523 RepID=A0ABP8J3C7_9BACT
MKISLFAFLLLLLGLFTQCGRPEEPTPPAKLVPQDKMVALLIDIHLLEARVEAASMQADSARALFNQQLKDIYWRHEVEEDVFRQSYQYYAVHDKDLEQLYATVIDSLGQREIKLNEATGSK